MFGHIESCNKIIPPMSAKVNTITKLSLTKTPSMEILLIMYSEDYLLLWVVTIGSIESLMKASISNTTISLCEQNIV